jgi:hypothetical protein
MIRFKRQLLSQACIDARTIGYQVHIILTSFVDAIEIGSRSR